MSVSQVPTGKSKGFTLLESILAVAISALIMASLTMIFQVTKQSWNKARTHAELIQHARVAMSRLSSELRYATNLTQANTSNIIFDTTVLVDTNEMTTESIRYQVVGNVLRRRVGGGAPYTVAGDAAPGGVVAQLTVVQPVKLDASNNVVPLLISDPLSLACGLDVELTLQKSSQAVNVRTLVNFRDK